jgi:hypothetical protein
MLATTQGDSEPTPDSEACRREVAAVLAALGPHLRAASHAIDGPAPHDARLSLKRAAVVLAPYLT